MRPWKLLTSSTDLLYISGGADHIHLSCLGRIGGRVEDDEFPAQTDVDRISIGDWCKPGNRARFIGDRY